MAPKLELGAAKYQYEVAGLAAVVEFVPANALLLINTLSSPTHMVGMIPACTIGDLVTLNSTVSLLGQPANGGDIVTIPGLVGTNATCIVGGKAKLNSYFNTLLSLAKLNPVLTLAVGSVLLVSVGVKL